MTASNGSSSTDAHHDSNPESASASETTEPQNTSMGDTPRQAGEQLERHYRNLEQTYDDARTKIENFNEQAADFVRDNPAVCIVGALAAGYLVGRLASRRWLT